MQDHGADDDFLASIDLEPDVELEEAVKQRLGTEREEVADFHVGARAEAAKGVPSTSFEDFLIAQGVVLTSESANRFTFAPADDKTRVLGYVHKIGGDEGNLKALCKRHDECVCWAKPRGLQDPDLLLRDLVEWLKAGSSSTSDEHLSLSEDVRTMYGHIVKPTAKKKAGTKAGKKAKAATIGRSIRPDPDVIAAARAS